MWHALYQEVHCLQYALSSPSVTRITSLPVPEVNGQLGSVESKQANLRKAVWMEHTRPFSQYGINTVLTKNYSNHSGFYSESLVHEWMWAYLLLIKNYFYAVTLICQVYSNLPQNQNISLVFSTSHLTAILDHMQCGMASNLCEGFHLGYLSISSQTRQKCQEVKDCIKETFHETFVCLYKKRNVVKA